MKVLVLMRNDQKKDNAIPSERMWYSSQPQVGDQYSSDSYRPVCIGGALEFRQHCLILLAKSYVGDSDLLIHFMIKFWIYFLRLENMVTCDNPLFSGFDPWPLYFIHCMNTVNCNIANPPDCEPQHLLSSYCCWLGFILGPRIPWIIPVYLPFSNTHPY